MDEELEVKNGWGDTAKDQMGLCLIHKQLVCFLTSLSYYRSQSRGRITISEANCFSFFLMMGLSSRHFFRISDYQYNTNKLRLSNTQIIQKSKLQKNNLKNSFKILIHCLKFSVKSYTNVSKKKKRSYTN